jgi:two-component system, NarL family, sensor histidine kinase UhpB
MSIQRRLIIAVFMVLSISILIGGALIYFYAINKVRTEMRAAMVVGTNIVRNTMDDPEEIAEPRRSLRLIIGDFNGDRHLVASLLTENNALLALSTPLAPEDPAPEWFAKLVGGDPTVAYLGTPSTTSDKEKIKLETTSANEVAEAWSDAKLIIGTLIIFCVLVLLLAYWTLSRALRPVEDVCAALSSVGEGNYSARLEQAVPSELEPLRTGFNAMAERLSEMESDNRRLTKQLISVQEEERAQIARDLHDEVGPFLFATGADATMIRQFLMSSALPDAHARAEAIIESVRHMQKHLRTILGRLRPGMLIDVGLEQAIHSLVEFWRARRPDIQFILSISVPSLGPNADDVVFRLVQESLSNAIRHAQPSTIQICISATEQEAFVEIIDDGLGFASENQVIGFGISGMRERVASAGGNFSTRNRADGHGVVVSANVPLSRASTGVEGDPVLSE